MYTISQFASKVNFSPKMLRHYDSIGLLKPYYVDPCTNYRYYSDDQIKILELIHELKTYGFSLLEIKNTFENYSTNFLTEKLNEKLKLTEKEIEFKKNINLSISNRLNTKKGEVLYMENKKEKIFIEKTLETFNKRNYQKAIKLYDKAIELDPLDPIFHIRKSETFLQYGNYLEALNCANISIKLNPTGYLPYSYKVTSLCNLKKIDEAISTCDEMIQNVSDKVSAYTIKGFLLFNVKNYADSEICYDKALKLDNNFSDAYYLKGLLFSVQMNIEKAIENFEKAITLDEFYKELIQKSHHLQSIKSSDKFSSFLTKIGVERLQEKEFSNTTILKILDHSDDNSGFILSKELRLSSDKSYENVAVIGPSGSTKSSGLFIPNILSLNGNVSAVVNDPNGDIYEKSKEYLSNLGYELIRLKILDPTVRYNPLLIADVSKSSLELKEISQLILINGNKSYELATGLTSNMQWLGIAAPLLTAALLYVRVLGEKRDITEAMNLLLDYNLEQLSQKFSKIPSALQEFKIFMQAGGNETTISEIKNTILNALQLFADPILEKLTANPFLDNGKLDTEKMFHPFMLRDFPCVLFIECPERKSNFLMPLISVIYAQLFDKCIEKYSDTSYPVLFMLDEFANIGIIPSMPQILATCSSKKIGLSLGFQGIEQLKRNYGEINTYEILNNLKTKVVFSGLTASSMEYISQLTEVNITQPDDDKILILQNNKKVFIGNKLS